MLLHYYRPSDYNDIIIIIIIIFAQRGNSLKNSLKIQRARVIAGSEVASSIEKKKKKKILTIDSRKPNVK